MTPKKIQKAMIKRNNKSAYTKPEQDFAAFLKDKEVIFFQQNISDWFFLPSGETIHFQMDFYSRPKFYGKAVDIEIDGKGHKEKWDHWKDEIKAANGIKVIHIPGELTKKHWWFYLNLKLKEALASPDMVVYIAE